MAKLQALFVLGTRPEAIKLAPIIEECRRRCDEITASVCFTGQHREMVRPIAEYFGICPDIDLGLMTPGQSLGSLTARMLDALDPLLQRLAPDCVVVQGDTTTVCCAALAAFYQRVPLVHVEAGLRTGDLAAPWPEEMNRRLASITAALHCAPTIMAVENLLAEGVQPNQIVLTGNPVVDALQQTVRRERANADRWRLAHAALADRRVVLITGHRRENFGDGLREICRAVAALADRFVHVEFVYPVHLNPHVHGLVRQLLSGRANIHLLPPVTYPEFVWLMDRSTLIITDSGGVQEEAPSLGKPVLVTRLSTERPEAVEAGIARLVGAKAETIIDEATKLLAGDARPTAMVANPYGDGHAAPRIVEAILSHISARRDSRH